MYSPTFLSTSSRGLRMAACGLTLLAAGAAAQDNDDDGVLPNKSPTNTTNSEATAPGAVGVAVSGPALDVLDAAEARLVVTDFIGPTELDFTAAPSDATFTATGAVNYEIMETSVGLQGDGFLTLPPGFALKFHAAPVYAARAAYLVLHSAEADAGQLLAGTVAPTLVLPVGDLPAMDVGAVHGLVANHADDLPGLALSVVFASLDMQGNLHLSAVRFATNGEPIEIAID